MLVLSAFDVTLVDEIYILSNLKTYSSTLIEENIVLKFKLLFNFRAPSAEFQLKLRNIIIKLRAVILPFFNN